MKWFIFALISLAVLSYSADRYWVVEVHDYDKEGLKKLFKRINTGGTAHLLEDNL